MLLYYTELHKGDFQQRTISIPYFSSVLLFFIVTIIVLVSFTTLLTLCFLTNYYIIPIGDCNIY